MIRRPGPVPFLMVALASSTAASSASGDESVNYQRLDAMPRERRAALAENLERFEKLDRREQASIRALDARLASMDPVDQARYRSTLRRYHLWVTSLTEEQKRSLKDAPTLDARLALARQLRVKGGQSGASGPRLAGIRIGDFGLVGPYEAAHLLRVWNKLTPARRAEIEKQQERGRMFAAIRNEARSAGVRFEPFPAEVEAKYTARLDGDAALKPLLGVIGRGPDPAPRKAESALKKADLLWKRSEHPIAEFLHFEENRPRAVAQKDLERFAAASPTWLRAMTDPLSPDDAREYLTILYRLLYVYPAEMPAEAKPPSASPPSPSAPRPPAGKETDAGPI